MKLKATAPINNSFENHDLSVCVSEDDKVTIMGWVDWIDIEYKSVEVEGYTYTRQYPKHVRDNYHNELIDNPIKYNIGLIETVEIHVPQEILRRTYVNYEGFIGKTFSFLEHSGILKLYGVVECKYGRHSINNKSNIQRNRIEFVFASYFGNHVSLSYPLRHVLGLDWNRVFNSCTESINHTMCEVFGKNWQSWDDTMKLEFLLNHINKRITRGETITYRT